MAEENSNSQSSPSTNPFALKFPFPARSSTDSSDDKDSSPGGDNHVDASEPGHCSQPRVILRPSLLTAQTENMQLVCAQEKESKHEMKGKDPGKKCSDNHHSVAHGSNGKLTRSELFFRGISTSFSELSSSAMSSGITDTLLQSGSKDTSSSNGSSFVFGQNLHERALNYGSVSVDTSRSATKAHNLTFEDAASKREELEEIKHEEQNEKLKSESAKEYESKQIKRKFDEVAVNTGEEEESNVLQMTCKLFAFNKSKKNWQERGRGILRLNDRICNGILQSRVVMRVQGSLRVMINTKVWKDMVVEHPSQKTVRLSAMDSEGVKVYLVMANSKDSEQLFHALDWRVKDLKSSNERNSADEKEVSDWEGMHSGIAKVKETSGSEEGTSSSGGIPSDDSNAEKPVKRRRIVDSTVDTGLGTFESATDCIPSDVKTSSDCVKDSSDHKNIL